MVGSSGRRRKVLSAVVLTLGQHDEYPELISVGQGSRCIKGEHISVEGRGLNDSHATVVARRGLQSFLYSQLEKIPDGESSV